MLLSGVGACKLGLLLTGMCHGDSSSQLRAACMNRGPGEGQVKRSIGDAAQTGGLLPAPTPLSLRNFLFGSMYVTPQQYHNQPYAGDVSRAHMGVSGTLLCSPQAGKFLFT